MMTDLNYKKYSLENLENWLYDAMSCGDATPQEIYDVIVNVVKDNYYTYKKQASEAYELLTLLNGDNLHKKVNTYQEMIDSGYEMTADGFWIKEDKKDTEDPCMTPWGHSDLEYLAKKSSKKDQVNRWVLPVELDGLSGECYIQLPDDLLERAGLQEGSMVHWIDRGDGSFELRKVTKPLGTDEC